MPTFHVVFCLVAGCKTLCSFASESRAIVRWCNTHSELLAQQDMEFTGIVRMLPGNTVNMSCGNNVATFALNVGKFGSNIFFLYCCFGLALA